MAAAQMEKGSATSWVGYEVVLNRTFDAPRSVAFKAWTDPKHLAQWWGPHGYTVPACKLDARPGGAILIQMAGPDGTTHPVKGEFREVAEPERLAFTTSVFEDEHGIPAFESLNTVTFAEHEGKTTITLRVTVTKATPDVPAGAIEGMDAGWSQTLERLEAHVAQRQDEGPTEGEFILSRVFNAPRTLVFQAWTDADGLERWFGAGCFKPISKSLDLRPGGIYHYRMQMPDGQTMWGRWLFREVVPPEKLVFVISFSDEAAGITRHPFMPNWPQEELATVTFAEHEGKTTVTMRSTPFNATEAECDAFKASREGMNKVWTATLDQLAGYLAQG